jgi:hypothetical protein
LSVSGQLFPISTNLTHQFFHRISTLSHAVSIRIRRSRGIREVF